MVDQHCPVLNRPPFKGAAIPMAADVQANHAPAKSCSGRRQRVYLIVARNLGTQWSRLSSG